jgi:BlaI family transcriptional regulator, penicillinase repressor
MTLGLRGPVSCPKKEKIRLDSLPFLCATVSNTMASNNQSGHERAGHDPAELGELERAILSIVWRLGSVSAELVREELERPLKDSTVRTVLRRLEEKGYLAHSLDNRTFLYRPAESRQRVAGRAVKRIVDWFCEGSVEALLVGMVDSKVLDRAELQRLAARIAVAQKATQKSGGKNEKKS